MPTSLVLLCDESVLSVIQNNYCINIHTNRTGLNTPLMHGTVIFEDHMKTPLLTLPGNWATHARELQATKMFALKIFLILRHSFSSSHYPHTF